MGKPMGYWKRLWWAVTVLFILTWIIWGIVALTERETGAPRIPAAVAQTDQPPAPKVPGEIKPWLNYDPTQMPLDQVLVGVWQDYPTMAAGWSNHYHFYPDGTFKFEYSQGDEERRVLDYSGTWTVDGATLTLAIYQKNSGCRWRVGPRFTRRYV